MTPRHLRNICISLTAATSLTGCITEDFPECPNEYELKIVFVRNMLNADAFASQVKSVDVKVFDPDTHQLVYSCSEQGAPLATGAYRMRLPVKPGSYDILCWGGMAEGQSFGYASPAAEIIDNFDVVLNTDNDGISRHRLNDLYHGLTRHITFTDNNNIGSRDVQTAEISLTKNTNRINVMLHNLDGTKLKDSDFSFRIIARNAEMAYDNSLSAQRRVEYQPWHISASTIIEDETPSSKSAVQTALAAEFVTGRLLSNANSRLEVVRNTDGERIIAVPLERNLLLFKGEFHSQMSDQEYLDREDDYNITFILDEKNNWNKDVKIQINGWSTLPIQTEEW